MNKTDQINGINQIDQKGCNGASVRLDADVLGGTLPEQAGVYLFKDRAGEVIYVGKAKNLRKRVLSYLRPSGDLPHKTARMLSRAKSLDFITTSTEKEAFILESNLVKEIMPRYNIVLRDDKQFPCLRLDLREAYPRLAIARRMKRDGALYFGPFSSANSVRRTMKVIDRIFQLRKCKGGRFTKRGRPCLNHQIDRCLGPCTQDIPQPTYSEIVKQVRLFLEGRSKELLETLQGQMEAAAAELDFERAARLRDQARAVERTIERQKVVSPRLEDRDVIGLAGQGERFELALLFVRRGYLVGVRGYRLDEAAGSPPEIMEAFLKQYYGRDVLAPPEILVSESLEDPEALSEWLSEMAGRRIAVHRPVRGEKRRLVEMALDNAENLVKAREQTRQHDLLTDLQRALQLSREPRRIEAVDISSLQGGQAVGVTVSFLNGVPDRGGYRNYRIRQTEAQDDYAMMAEVVERRLEKGNLPDLLLLDGGKGHLAAVEKVLRAVAAAGGEGCGEMPEIASLAKADEGRGDAADKVYLPGRKNPVALRPDHPVLLLLMRIRDEAHRRAISYHRRLRGKALRASQLESVPGIGPKRKRLLMRHFRGLEALREARLEDLAGIKGMTRPAAEQVFAWLHVPGDGGADGTLPPSRGGTAATA